MATTAIYKIEFYVPESHLETVKSAMFEAGAGRLGNYDSCAWQTAGEGQYRPGEGSRPFLGERDKLETFEEYKVEMACAEEFITAAIESMKQVHPYEEVAYSVVRKESFE